jgi:hypothetical protein
VNVTGAAIAVGAFTGHRRSRRVLHRLRMVALVGRRPARVQPRASLSFERVGAERVPNDEWGATRGSPGAFDVRRSSDVLSIRSHAALALGRAPRRDRAQRAQYARTLSARPSRNRVPSAAPRAQESSVCPGVRASFAWNLASGGTSDLPDVRPTCVLRDFGSGCSSGFPRGRAGVESGAASPFWWTANASVSGCARLRRASGKAKPDGVNPPNIPPDDIGLIVAVGRRQLTQHASFIFGQTHRKPDGSTSRPGHGVIVRMSSERGQRFSLDIQERR